MDPRMKAAVAVVMLAALAACGGKGKEAATGAASDNGGATAAIALVASEGTPAVETASPSLGAIEESVDATGTLQAKYMAEIKPEYGGVVTDVFVTEWARVSKGTPLLKIDTREGEVARGRAEAGLAAAKAQVAEAKSAATRANREVERAKNLKASGLITRQAEEDAQTAKEAADARVVAADAQVVASERDVEHAVTRLSKATVVAPFDGVVEQRMVNPGTLVGEMQSVVFRIVDNRVLDLVLLVPSSESGKVRIGQGVQFRTDAFPGRVFSGRVAHINPSFDQADRSLRVTAEVRNVPEILRGGLFVTGKIATGNRDGVLLVPRPALTAWDVEKKTAELLVVDADGTVRRRKVVTGAVKEDAVEVTAGVSASDRVIVRGGFLAKDGQKVVVATSAPQASTTKGR